MVGQPTPEPKYEAGKRAKASAEARERAVAEAEAAKKKFKYFDTGVPGFTGAAGGDVVIREGARGVPGQPAAPVIFSSGGLKGAQGTIQLTSSPVVEQPFRPSPFSADRSVVVSGGVAAKLAREQQGRAIRADVPYSVSIGRRERVKPEFFSVSKSQRAESEREQNLKEYKVREREKGKELGRTLSAGVIPAVEYFSEKQPGPRLTSKFPFFTFQSGEVTETGLPTIEEQRRQAGGEAAAGLFISGGSIITSNSFQVKPSRVYVKSRAAVKQVASGDLVTGEARISGEVLVKKRNIFGFMKDKRFVVGGRAVESGQISDVLGLKSGEPIIKTGGAARLKLTPKGKSQPKYIVSVESVGNEVAGIGQRKVLSEVSLPKAGRSLGVDKSVESYISLNKEDVVLGGVASRKGANIYAGTKVGEISGQKILSARYYSPELGLESATPTLNLNQPSVFQTVKFFDIKNVGTSKVPPSARITRRVVRGRLLEEKPIFSLKDLGVDEAGISSRGVSPVAREQLSASGGVVQIQKSPVSGVGFIDTKGLIKQSVIVAETTKIKPLSILPINSRSPQQSLTVSVQRNRQQFAIPQIKIDALSSSFSGIKPVDLTGQKLFSEIRNVSRSKTIPSTKLGVTPLLEPATVQRPVQVTEVKPVQIESQISKTQNVFSPSRPFSPRTQVPIPKISVILPFKLPKGGKGSSFGVVVRRFGKFKEIGKASEFGKALKIGKQRVANTAAATFKIQQGGRDIYKYVEPNRFRIKSQGELREITLKGVAASKAKRRKGKRVSFL